MAVDEEGNVALVDPESPGLRDRAPQQHEAIQVGVPVLADGRDFGSGLFTPYGQKFAAEYVPGFLDGKEPIYLSWSVFEPGFALGVEIEGLGPEPVGGGPASWLIDWRKAVNRRDYVFVDPTVWIFCPIWGPGVPAPVVLSFPRSHPCSTSARAALARVPGLRSATDPAFALQLPVFLFGVQEQFAKVGIPLCNSQISELHRCKGLLCRLGRRDRCHGSSRAQARHEGPAQNPGESHQRAPSLIGLRANAALEVDLNGWASAHGFLSMICSAVAAEIPIFSRNQLESF
jgi:hypothetical protein